MLRQLFHLILSERCIADAVSNMKITAENITINASNIHGKITNEQIESVDFSKITGAVAVDSKNITGKIINSQIESVAASKITGKITNDKIESIKADQISGNINAFKISGTIESDKISNDLNDKNVTGIFNGNVVASSVKTTYNGVIYNTVSGEFTVGDMTLKFVNGLLVEVSG